VNNKCYDGEGVNEGIETDIEMTMAENKRKKEREEKYKDPSKDCFFRKGATAERRSK
jgi:hypothetical protein